jgi:hypothetical protein
MKQKLKRPYGFVGFEKFLCQCYQRKVWQEMEYMSVGWKWANAV